MTRDKNILIRNIYYMLAYAFRDFRFSIDDNIAGEHFEETHDLFAEILIRGISCLLKRGLFKTYESNEGKLSTIRGRIDLYKTHEIEQNNPYQAYCIYDELTENNIYNQILKAALQLLLRCENVSTSRKDHIRSILPYFQKIDMIDLRIVRWNTISFDRRNSNYQMLVNICKFIIEDMLMTTEAGTYRMKSLSEKNMNLLFQRFVLAYYQRLHPETNARSEQIPWNFKNRNRLLPIMQTDIIMSLDERTLIIDTKYYTHILNNHYDKQIINNGHLMQLQSYLTNYDVTHSGKVDGMLLYAKTEKDSSLDDDCEEPYEQPDGNRFYIRTLDLNQQFQNICAQLDRHINEIKGIRASNNKNNPRNII